MRPKVAVLKTSPETVMEDYGRLMRMAGYEESLGDSARICLQADISWDLWYPACSTTPWQLEGVLKALADDGRAVDSIVSAGDCPGSAGGGRGLMNNGLAAAAGKYGLSFSRGGDDPAERVRHEPGVELRALADVFGDGGLSIPGTLMGSSLILMPTLKTHALTMTSGAVRSAAAGLLDGHCPAAQGSMHEVLVDLLAIRQELHAGLFAVMDGTFCGDGPGPRALMPYEKDYIIAGSDLVAVDAVAARMMGFDPMGIGYIRMAHERGLGCGEIAGIDVEGADIREVDFHFQGPSGAQPHGGLGRPFKKLTGMPPAGGKLATRAYFDYFWYPWVGWPRLSRMAETKWGQMLQGYLPEGAGLESQGPGKSPLIAAAAAALLGMGAFRRVMSLARGEG
ncbi:MAG: DUF362 domain-containing protein [Gaiellales bacterium]|nr:MAG: DUF362 domain-containing protein [Gaiellales bacterium]